MTATIFDVAFIPPMAFLLLGSIVYGAGVRRSRRRLRVLGIFLLSLFPAVIAAYYFALFFTGSGD